MVLKSLSVSPAAVSGTQIVVCLPVSGQWSSNRLFPRQGRLKAEKNRLRVQEIFLKQTHQSRAEKAQAKREEKRRQEKERILEVSGCTPRPLP